MKLIKSTLISLSITILSTMIASAQFTTRPSSTTTTKTESVKINPMTTTTPDSVNVQTAAYERYAKMMRFRYRNKISFLSSVDIGQTSFDNWAAGGSNSFSGRLWTKFTHTYKNEKSNFNIISDIEGAYKMVIADKKATKSEDYLNISSTPSWKLTERLEISGSAIIKTQFANSYIATSDTTSVLSSSFFAPATITISAGITYTTKNSVFTAFFAPVSGNATLVLNDELAAIGTGGVAPGKNTKAELGMFTKIIYNQPFFKKSANFYSKVESFWNYKDCPTLWWENRLTYKFNAIFGVTLYLKVLYDQSIATPRADENNYWQINQSLGLNLTFNFKSKDNVGELLY